MIAVREVTGTYASKSTRPSTADGERGGDLGLADPVQPRQHLTQHHGLPVGRGDGLGEGTVGGPLDPPVGQWWDRPDPHWPGYRRPPVQAERVDPVGHETELRAAE